MSEKDIIVKNVRVFYSDQKMIKTDVLISEGIFANIGHEICQDIRAQIIDGDNLIMLPGFINLHDDTVEHFLLPRNTWKISNINFENILLQYLSMCFLNGITTNYITLTASLEPGIRNWELCNNFIEILNNQIYSLDMLNNVKINYRYEIVTNKLDNLYQLINDNLIDIVTFNDHAAFGISGWDDNQYFKNINYRCKIDKKRYENIFNNTSKNREEFWNNIYKIRKLETKKNIKYAIHDIKDKSLLECFDFDFLEFPLDIETVELANKNGIKSVMGASNYLYGTTQVNGLNAVSLIENKNKIILCSDYVISSLLDIVNKWYENKECLDLIRMITSRPAKLMELNKGIIDEGKDADFVLFSETGSKLVLDSTYIMGKKVYKNFMYT